MKTELTQLQCFIFTKVARQQRWRVYVTPLIAPRGHRARRDSQLTFCPLYLHLFWNHTWCARELRSHTLHKSREICFSVWSLKSLVWLVRLWSGRGQRVKVGRAWLVWGIAGKSCNLSCEAYKDAQTDDNSQSEGDRAPCTEDSICRRCGQTKSFTSF